MALHTNSATTNAAITLAMGIGVPSKGIESKSAANPRSGVATKNARAAAGGTPFRISEAYSGSTPHEHSGNGRPKATPLSP